MNRITQAYTLQDESTDWVEPIHSGLNLWLNTDAHILLDFFIAEFNNIVLCDMLGNNESKTS